MSDDPLVEQDDASTPLSPEEQEGLVPSYITLRSELNEAEQANIVDAEEWAFKRKRDTLSEKSLNDLHKRMFGRVWKWAGQYRRISSYDGPNRTASVQRDWDTPPDSTSAYTLPVVKLLCRVMRERRKRS